MQDEFWDLSDESDEIDAGRFRPRRNEQGANMTPYEFLRQRAESMPPWLANFADGDGFNRQNFFASRIVFYPGSGFDGQPVKLFGSTHSAHCFVYSDYSVTEDHLAAALEHPRGKFLGYTTLARIRLAESDLAPRGWVPHVRPGDVGSDSHRFVSDDFRPFGFLDILQRDEQRDEQHGPERLAILFLGADGIATYDALFCQEPPASNPYAVVLQDHGFGGNYSRFGRRGLLERIARRCRVLPQWLLVTEHTPCWNGFSQIPGVDGDLAECTARFGTFFQSADELDLPNKHEGTGAGRI